MAALTTMALIGAGVGLAGAGLSAFGKKDPKFDTSGIQNAQNELTGFQGQFGEQGLRAQNLGYELQNNFSNVGSELGSMRMQGAPALNGAGRNIFLGGMDRLSGLKAPSTDLGEYGAAAHDYAAQLGQYAQAGAMPSSSDISRANDYAASQFGAQRVAMQQAFDQQLTQANRQAALSGRGVNDPILKAKLAQEQARQQALIDAQQTAFASQFAQQQPKERLQFAEGRLNVLTNKFQQQQQQAQQGFQNQMSLGQLLATQALQLQQQDLATQGQMFNQNAMLFDAGLKSKQAQLAAMAQGGQFRLGAEQLSSAALANQFGAAKAKADLAQAIAQGKFQQDASETTFAQRLGSTLSGGVAGIGAGLSMAGGVKSLMDNDFNFDFKSLQMPAFGGVQPKVAGLGDFNFGSNPTARNYTTPSLGNYSFA
jgi:hypothetical protein